MIRGVLAWSIYHDSNIINNNMRVKNTVKYMNVHRINTTNKGNEAAKVEQMMKQQ